MNFLRALRAAFVSFVVELFFRLTTGPNETEHPLSRPLRRRLSHSCTSAIAFLGQRRPRRGEPRRSARHSCQHAFVFAASGVAHCVSRSGAGSLAQQDRARTETVAGAGPFYRSGAAAKFWRAAPRPL